MNILLRSIMVSISKLSRNIMSILLAYIKNILVFQTAVFNLSCSKGHWVSTLI